MGDTWLQCLAADEVTWLGLLLFNPKAPMCLGGPRHYSCTSTRQIQPGADKQWYPRRPKRVDLQEEDNQMADCQVPLSRQCQPR